MTDSADIVTVTLQVTHVLEALNIPYVVCGSMASSAYGRPRATMDVDLVADVQPENVPTLKARLGDSFYLDEGAALRAIASRHSFNLIHFATAFKVDIFIPKARPFDYQQIQRGQRTSLSEAEAAAVQLASREDTLLAKLEWFRMGGEVSDRQWSDILGILEAHAHSLDHDYLTHWAAELQVADLLLKALDQNSQL